MTNQVSDVEFKLSVDAKGAITSITNVSNRLEGLSKDFDDVEKSSVRFRGGAKKTEGALGGLSRRAGMAGVQIQQFFGQIQGGQSGLLALSQQGADLGIVLGAAGLGSAIGLTATALSFMVGDSNNAKDSLKRLQDVADAVGETFVKASDGSDKFSEAIRKLTERSESLARVQIAQTISEISADINSTVKEVSNALRDIGAIRLDVGLLDTLGELGIQLEDFPDLFGDISEEVDKLGAGGALTIRSLTERIDLMADSFDISREQALSLQVALDDFASDKSAVGIARLRSAIEDLSDEVGVDNDAFNKLSATLLPFFETTRVGVDRVNLLRQALSDLSTEIEKGAADPVSPQDNSKEANRYQKRLELLQNSLNLEGETIANANAKFAALAQEGANEQLAILDEQLANERARKDFELERDKMSFAEERASILENEALNAEQKASLVDELRQLELQSKEQHENALTNIEQKAAEARNKIAQKESKDRLSAVSSSFGALSNLMNTESRKLFEIGKVAATANAIIDGIAAAQGAYKVGNRIGGPPVGAAFAAAAAAGALTNIKQIQSTQFGSTSTGQSFQGGQVVNNVAQTQGPQEPNRNISIALTGSSFSGGDIRELIGAINDELGDGASLNIAST